MHIQHAHIRTLHMHLHHQPSQVASTLGAFLRDTNDTPTPGATAHGQLPHAFPRIAQPWADVDGIYVGVSRGEVESEPDAHLVLLNATPGKRLPHPEARAWAQALGDGAHLPSKNEGALLYAHLREHLAPERWIWLHEQYGASSAWYQHFNNGSQLDNDLSAGGGVRAVRRFPLQPLNTL
jgi:hypothetical protein